MAKVTPRAKKPVFTAGKPRKHRLSVPPPLPETPVAMTPAMVDRLFWRAGFGPTAADRSMWTGKAVAEAVDSLLNTPQGGLIGPAPTRDGKALDPLTEDVDLVLAWVDQMVRSPNPLVERLTFFWHRHWANSRMAVDPPQLLVQQNKLFRSYADLGANAAADFKNFAYAVSEDPSMLRYLNGESNVKGGPNENYARELMELFALGVFNDAGAATYTEDDVKGLAKAMSGWRIDETDPNNAVAVFDSSRWFSGPKRVLGVLSNYHSRDAVDAVLGSPAHAPFLLRKLWSEFIVGPPDAPTLADLVKTYGDTGRQLKPVVRKILTHPQLFASPNEPNMIKSPVVYVVGLMRAMGVFIKDQSPYDALDAMGQVPYFPPTVAGWEGGASWLNTNTALARFAYAAKLVTTVDPKPTTTLGERPEEAFARAYAAVGAPWISDATKTALLDYATRARSSTSDQRGKRQLVLRTLLLAGPDAQVM